MAKVLFDFEYNQSFKNNAIFRLKHFEKSIGFWETSFKLTI